MSRTLERIAKMLNLAENAATPEEAANAMEMVQRLASQSGIELAVARAHTLDKEKREEVVKDRAVMVSPHNRKFYVAHFMDLWLAVTVANDVRCTIGRDNRYAYATGFPSDIEVCEALYGLLMVRMAADCDAALAAGKHREWRQDPRMDEGAEGSLELVVTPAQVYRANFYGGFTHSTRVRLLRARAEARIKAGAEDESSATAVALRDKSQEVDGAFDEVMDKLKQLNPRGVGNYGGAEVSRYDDGARGAGAEAAQRVKYGTEDNAVSTTHRKELA